jgi:hypothetical protein
MPSLGGVAGRETIHGWGESGRSGRDRPTWLGAWAGRNPVRDLERHAILVPAVSEWRRLLPKPGGPANGAALGVDATWQRCATFSLRVNTKRQLVTHQPGLFLS